MIPAALVRGDLERWTGLVDMVKGKETIALRNLAHTVE